jgi:endonuclease/exonuclease/phosphatase (EEP) superfamily protein YafD
MPLLLMLTCQTHKLVRKLAIRALLLVFTCWTHEPGWALTIWRAPALQLAQVRVLLEAAAAMADAPTLVAGDFNSGPASGVHRFCSR